MAKKASAKTRTRKTTKPRVNQRAKVRPKLARSSPSSRSRKKLKPKPKPARKASYRVQRAKTYYRAKDLNDKVTRLKPTKGAKLEANQNNVEDLLMRAAQKSKWSKKPTVRFGARVRVRFRHRNKTHFKTISSYADSYQEALEGVLNDALIKEKKFVHSGVNASTEGYFIEKGIKVYNASFVQIVKEKNELKISKSRKKAVKRKKKNRSIRRRK